MGGIMFLSLHQHQIIPLHDEREAVQGAKESIFGSFFGVYYSD